MNVLLWNVRGVQKPSFRSTFSRWIQLYRPSICILVETRLSGAAMKSFTRSLGGSWDMQVMEAVGMSGGIIVLWRLDRTRVECINGMSQSMTLVISPEVGPAWALVGVYASTCARRRRQLWGELSAILEVDIPAVVMGDFNCILGGEDKRGGRAFRRDRAVMDFSAFVEESGVVDLGYQGPRFTWCNNRSGAARVWERIDRCFATASWIQLHPECVVRHLPRIASDHCPVLLSVQQGIACRPPFRFEDFWLSYPSSWEVIREVWRIPIRGDPGYRLSRRLELLGRRLRRWNRTVVGRIPREVGQLEETIRTLQQQEAEEGGLEEGDLAQLRSSVSRHHSILRDQETLWRQKSRIRWLREGDRNTAFFHRATVIRRHRNRIRRLRREDGTWEEDPDRVTDRMLSFFRDRWSEVERGAVGVEGDWEGPPRVPGSVRRIVGDWRRR